MASSPPLVLSNRLDVLAKILARTLEEEGTDPFSARIILTSSKEMRTWLLMQLARFSSRKAIAGLKIFSWQEGIRYLLNQPGKELAPLELYALLYGALRTSEEPVLQEYMKQVGGRELAHELTDLFTIYGYYGWSDEREDWQKKIWEKIFAQGPWKAPSQLLGSSSSPYSSVYCFGCNHLPPVVWDALFRLPELTIFQFSPCMVYWEDVRTDRERKGLLRAGKKRGVAREELDQMRMYLSEAHPLLANWGKLGRSTLACLQARGVEMQEVYQEPPEALSDLAQLQREIILSTASGEARQDGSVKIHKTGVSKIREVQVLREEMLRAHEQGILFSDMLVLAPDLSLFAPLIEWIFSEEPFSIPYQLLKVDRPAEGSVWQGVERLFALSQSRWDVEDVLFLFEHAAFRAKKRWDLQRLDQIRAWLQEARIRWGYEAEEKRRHAASWLGEPASEISARGTWEEGIDRFVASLLYLLPEGESPFIHPIAGAGLCNADEVEELLQLLVELKRDLEILANGSERTLSQWADILSALFETYFILDAAEDVQQMVRTLRKAGEKIDLALPFSALLPELHHKQKGTVGSTLLHAARFASFEEGCIVPCRALFLIGMDEESFPQRSPSSSLNRCKKGPESPPLRSDIDRYLFLQAIMSAQDLVHISYGHISPEDGKELAPSILLQEWLSCVKQLPATLHPMLPKEKKGEKKIPLQCVSFARPPEPACPQGPILLKDLRAAFSHPWKYYLRKTAAIWLQEGAKEDWSDFEMSAIERSYVLGAGLSQPMDKLVHSLEKKGHFPFSLFGKIAHRNLTEENSEYREHLSSWNIRPDELFTARFPPLKASFAFVGEGPLCSPRGPIHLGDDSFSALLRQWPLYLTALLALEVREIFCVRSGKVKVVENPLEALKACLELYELAAVVPLPLVSSWADPLVRKRDPEALQKVLSGDSRFGWEDPVYEWMLARVGPLAVSEIVKEWGDYLHERLKPLVELYPVRGKAP